MILAAIYSAANTISSRPTVSGLTFYEACKAANSEGGTVYRHGSKVVAVAFFNCEGRMIATNLATSEERADLADNATLFALAA